MTEQSDYFNPKAKNAVIGGILTRLDSLETVYKSTDGKVDLLQEGLLEIRGWLKALVAVWAVVLLTGSLLGWLLSNQYLVFQNPNRPVHVVNATIP